LRECIEWLKKLLASAESHQIPRTKIARLARQHGFLDTVLIKARPLAGVVSERSKENSRYAIWSLVKMSNGTNGHTSEPSALNGEQKIAGEKLPKTTRRRRRIHQERTYPLTVKQIDAVLIVKEHKGNFAAAARAAGKSRAAIMKLYEKAASKLGKKDFKLLTQRLPRDARGQEIVVDENQDDE